jgi:hypothetical protein
VVLLLKKLVLNNPLPNQFPMMNTREYMPDTATNAQYRVCVERRMNPGFRRWRCGATIHRRYET